MANKSKKPTARKPVARKRPAARKPAAKKPAVRKPAARYPKPVRAKSQSFKPAAKKPARKKVPTRVSFTAMKYPPAAKKPAPALRPRGYAYVGVGTVFAGKASPQIHNEIVRIYRGADGRTMADVEQYGSTKETMNRKCRVTFRASEITGALNARRADIVLRRNYTPQQAAERGLK